MVLLRSVAAIMAGIVTTIVTMLVLELPLLMQYNLPRNLDPSTPEGVAILADHIANAPISAGFLLIANSFAATFVGAAVAAALAVKGKVWHAWAIGALFFASGVSNFVRIRHPLWIVVGSLLAYPLAACIAGWLVTRKKPALPY